MSDTVQQLITACQWDTVRFLFISGNVFDPLIYYSHLLPLIVSLSLGIFLYIKSKDQLAPKVLLATILFLAMWLLGDLIVWATDQPNMTMFAWSIVNMTEPIVYAGTLYFLYVFIDQKDINFKKKLIIALLLLPTIVLSFTHFGLTAYNLTTCDRDAVEGPLATYGYIIEGLFVLWGLGMVIKRFIKNKSPVTRRQIALISIGSLGFLTTFAFGNIIGTWFSNLNVLGSDYSWSIGQYGIFGVPLFIAFLAYILVAYKSFNTKVFGGQILVGGLVIIISSEFFFVKTLANTILTAITLIVSLIFGLLLIRSIKKEIQTREHIEKLAKELQKANTRLKELDQQKTEFISLATHQIRGPLGSIKGYTSMLLEGDFGDLPVTAKNSLNTIMKSAAALVILVNDYLDVSRIEQGRMTFDFSDFDLKDLVKTVVNEYKPTAEEKKLTMTFECDETKSYLINADMGKIKQVIGNLLDNSVKYTPTGSIHVSIAHEKKNDGTNSGKLLIAIKDTGVGIRPEVMPNLFAKFSRAPDASKTNIMGTGLGLFVARKMIEAHKGRVWAESKGQDKGSEMYIELMGK